MNLTNAITTGSQRVLTRTGGVLFAVLFLQQALLITALNTIVEAQAPSEAANMIGVTLPISGTIAGAILIGTLLFSAVYFVVVARAFARPITELSSLPAELYTRRIGRASLTMFFVGLIVSIAVMVGFAFLIIPGLFLATCLLFVMFTVGVEDRGVVGALKQSWSLSKGNRLRLGIIVLIVGVISTLIGIVPAVLQMVGAAALGDFVAILTNSVLFMFVYGIIAAAYLQLADEDGGIGGSKTDVSTTTEGVQEV